MHLALFKLGTEKSIQDNMFAEIKRYLKPGNPVDESVLEKAKYTKAFLKEVLRLNFFNSWIVFFFFNLYLVFLNVRYYPIVLGFGRVVKQDMILNGYKIPKGVFIYL